MILNIESMLKPKMSLNYDPGYGLFSGYPHGSLDSNYQSIKVRPKEVA